MDSKIYSKLDEIENHLARLEHMVQLLERLIETNKRTEEYMATMMRIYQEAMVAQQNGITRKF